MAGAAGRAGDADSPPGTWSHLWFAGVRECPSWCSIIGATVTVHQFFCILHSYPLVFAIYMLTNSLLSEIICPWPLIRSNFQSLKCMPFYYTTVAGIRKAKTAKRLITQGSKPSNSVTDVLHCRPSRTELLSL